MDERGKVRLRELELFEDSFCTARPFADYAAVFRLRINQDMTVLDVGAGGSDFTSTLLAAGIDTYALDPIYGNVSQVRKKVGDHSRLMISTSSSQFSRTVWEQFAKRNEATLETFEQSAQQNPDNYVEGFATEIPFPDNFFDYTLAFNSITEYLDFDFETFKKATEELLRVTKPGGIIEIQPFGERKTRIFEITPIVHPMLVAINGTIKLRNQQWLLDDLAKRGIYTEFLPAKSERATLLIVKPE